MNVAIFKHQNIIPFYAFFVFLLGIFKVGLLGIARNASFLVPNEQIKHTPSILVYL